VEVIIMKKIIGILFLSGVLMVSSAVEQKDIEHGQKVFMKSLKGRCGVNGAKFALNHTQDEWDELFKQKKLNIEIDSLCGNKKIDLNDDELNDLYSFFFNFASDSGNVPSCG
jgi:hypothetical protein